MRLPLLFIDDLGKLHGVVGIPKEVILLGGSRLVAKLKEYKRRVTDAWHWLLRTWRHIFALHQYKPREVFLLGGSLMVVWVAKLKEELHLRKPRVTEA